MWHKDIVNFIYLLIAIAPELINGLKDVSVTVPKAVKRGESALLVCNYDMEEDTLYSVKWYKGRREFYRYTPKEKPAMKIFSHPGIIVDMNESNERQVVLITVPLNITGKFSCEVSADAPTFHTVIESGEMEVVEIPEQRPVITGIHSRYRIGDVINGNCSSDDSKPAANLTWSINDITVFPNYVRELETQKNTELNLESATTQINFIVTHQHFIRGRLKLKCVAKIHNLYEQEAQKLIEEDRPRILASGTLPDVYISNGEMNDGSEYYLTHYKESRSSAPSLMHFSFINSKAFAIYFIIFYIFFYCKPKSSDLPTNVKEKPTNTKKYKTRALTIPLTCR